MRKYTKYVFETMIVIALFAALISLLNFTLSHDTADENDAYSDQYIMTQAHPRFEEVIEEMRQNDPDDIYEHYERFKDNIPS